MEKPEPGGDRPATSARDEARVVWRDYQQPLRWDWGAAAFLGVLFLLAVLVVLIVLQKL